MDRRTIHRGVAALAIVTCMSLALAQPAAAAPRAGAMGRITDLWSAVAGGDNDSLWNRLTVWLAGKPAGKTPRATVKRGWGLDPNGNRVYYDDPPTTTPGAPGSPDES